MIAGLDASDIARLISAGAGQYALQRVTTFPHAAMQAP
jgi:hypothetical protein